MIQVTIIDQRPIIRTTVLPQGGYSGGGVTDHEQLTGRDADDQHPIGAITGLQTELDSKALKQIQFFPTEQIEAFTITAAMLYKLVYINSATDVEVTVAEMGVGDWIPFDLRGAGLPKFFLGGTELFTDEDFTGATSFILIRIEDDNGNEQYDIKYG